MGKGPGELVGYRIACPAPLITADASPAAAVTAFDLIRQYQVEQSSVMHEMAKQRLSMFRYIMPCLWLLSFV